MKKFRKKQIWKACKMSPVGKSNYIRKCYREATAPSWFSLTYMAVDFLWDAMCKPHEREE